MDPKSMKNRGCIADALLERLGPPRDERRKQKVTPVWRHLANLGRHLTPAGRQGSYRIHHFGIKMHKKLKKWCPGRGARKLMLF